LFKGTIEYQLRSFNLSMSGLHFTLMEYGDVVRNFTDTMKFIALKDPLLVRITNDKILQAFKVFGRKITTCDGEKSGFGYRYTFRQV